MFEQKLAFRTFEYRRYSYERKSISCEHSHYYNNGMLAANKVRTETNSRFLLRILENREMTTWVFRVGPYHKRVFGRSFT